MKLSLRDIFLSYGQWHLRRNRALVMGCPSVSIKVYLLRIIEEMAHLNDRPLREKLQNHFRKGEYFLFLFSED